MHRCMKIVSWNIKAGRGFAGILPSSNPVQYLNLIADALLEMKAETVLLQEVDINVKRSGRIHQPEYLKERLEKASGRSWKYCFGEAIDYQGGNFGNCVLSCFEIEDFINIKLHPFKTGKENRNFLMPLVQWKGSRIGVGSFHLSVKPSQLRVQEGKIIKDVILKEGIKRCVIGGDLNAGRGGDTYHTIKEYGEEFFDAGPWEGYSYISAKDKYRARIDFIFLKGLDGRCAAIYEYEGISDHFPISVEIEP